MQVFYSLLKWQWQGNALNDGIRTRWIGFGRAARADPVAPQLVNEPSSDSMKSF